MERKEEHGKKDYLVRMFGVAGDAELDAGSPWLSLFLHDRLLAVINGYLGVFSKLNAVDVWNTVPVVHDGADQGSQRWHRDPEDSRLVKVFLYLSDVDAGAGAMQYVAHSRRGDRYGSLWPQKFPAGNYPPAGALERIVDPRDRIDCSGPSGTLLLVDTCGFHRGGRATTARRVLATSIHTTPASPWPASLPGVRRRRERGAHRGATVGGHSLLTTPPARPRVAHVITRLIVGGAQENTLASVVELRRRGRFDADLILGPTHGPEGTLVPEARRLGVEPRLIRSLRREVNPLLDPVALGALTLMFRRDRYDIVHTHSSKAGVLGRIAACAARVPAIVHTVHGWGFNDRQPLLVNKTFTEAERWCAGFTDALVTVTPRDTEVGLALGIGRPAQYTTIRSGIDIAHFRTPRWSRQQVRGDLGLPADAPVVVGIMRLVPQKAPLDFIEAAGRLLREVPDARVLIVGDGPLRQQAEARCRTLRIRDRVVFTGLRTDVPDLLAAADVLGLASLWEGLPRVIPQAMAGRPARGGHCGGRKRRSGRRRRYGHSRSAARPGRPRYSTGGGACGSGPRGGDGSGRTGSGRRIQRRPDGERPRGAVFTLHRVEGPMRLTLVIGSLRCGGAERVLTSLANGWRRDGHAVTPGHAAGRPRVTLLSARSRRVARAARRVPPLATRTRRRRDQRRSRAGVAGSLPAVPARRDRELPHHHQRAGAAGRRGAPGAGDRVGTHPPRALPAARRLALAPEAALPARERCRRPDRPCNRLVPRTDAITRRRDSEPGRATRSRGPPEDSSGRPRGRARGRAGSLARRGSTC